MCALIKFVQCHVLVRIVNIMCKHVWEYVHYVQYSIAAELLSHKLYHVVY